MVVVVVIVLHLHCVNKGWLLLFVVRVKFDEESIGDGLSVVVFSGAVATALMILLNPHEILSIRSNIKMSRKLTSIIRL